MQPPLPTALPGKGRGPPPRRGEEAVNQSLPPALEPTALSFRASKEDLHCLPSALRPTQDETSHHPFLTCPRRVRVGSATPPSPQLRKWPARPEPATYSAARVASLASNRPRPLTTAPRTVATAYWPTGPPLLSYWLLPRCGRVSKEQRNPELKAPAPAPAPARG